MFCLLLSAAAVARCHIRLAVTSIDPLAEEDVMATRVTMPTLDPATRSPTGDAPTAGATIPVAKVQLLNDRGDRRAEARWLTEAARPGVVELVSTSEDPFTIITAHAGSRTLRTARLDPDTGLDLMIQLTQLLSDLHRDDFVHGKLTVDHVIIGPDGPALCSPDGTATTSDVDLAGIARCMQELARQWDEAEASSPWRSQWDALARRLDDATDPSASAVRTTQALRRMRTAAASRPTPAIEPDRRVPRGLALAAAAVLIAVAGMALVPDRSPGAATGPRIVVDDGVYAVGSKGDDVTHLESPCDPNAPVVVLRPSTGEVWAFSSIEDGARAAPLAIVPGATDLRSEQRADRPCDVAVARGPAGATNIDTAALMDTTPSDENTPEAD